MRYVLISVLVLLSAGCVVDKHRKQQVNVHIVLRGIDVQNPKEDPGTAEVGSSYSVSW